ncbi:perlucin-like protein isoform X1 [Argopecten irradians]|uniref:perlucin-like protein isoform X1 n=1 Tax=Argopecten irradians TaxID=31199 RepID=UPI0037122B5A
MYTVRVSLVFVTLGYQVAIGCPDGWSEFDGSCYSVSSQKLNWIDAVDACHTTHSYVVEIGSKKENDFLEHLTRHKHDKIYWLGGSDAVVEDHWRWMSKYQTFNYTNWHHGEPNNLDQGESCLAAVHRSSRFEWRDYHCEDKNRFICEMRGGSWIVLG